MNIQIKKNEYKNDGTQVHLYYNPHIDMWAAYGRSAYSLRLYAKNRGYDSLRTFSSEFGMPCTVITNGVMKTIRQTIHIIHEVPKSSMHFQRITPFPSEDYINWTAKLNHDEDLKTGLNIKTRVSEYVPRDRFIPDSMSSFSRNVKRLGDCILSFFALIVFSPLFLICYILIKMEDGGPAIFKQERIGRFGKPFNIYKFRSMRLDAEKFGPQLSHAGGEDDPRLTKIGKFIRAHHLDELPQLWNVFTGDMAFIGPRPERKFYIDQIMEYDKRYAYLYQIRPGVTSYATLYNGYTDTIEKMLQRLEYDLYYLSKRSWWFDFKILLNTFASIVFGKKF